MHWNEEFIQHLCACVKIKMLEILASVRVSWGIRANACVSSLMRETWQLCRSTPPSLVAEALSLFDSDIRRCFTECTSVDVSDVAWHQAQLSPSRGGLGLRSLYHHSSACFIASIIVSQESPWERTTIWSSPSMTSTISLGTPML